VTEDTRRSALSPRAVFGTWRDSAALTLTVDQWGLLGCVLLYAMWFCHLLLFSGTSLSSWIGLLVVVQNIVSSLLNSHLFDFHEGWMYVLGVGVAGGTALKMRVGRSESHVGKVRLAVIVGMRDKDRLTPAGNAQARMVH